jgi:hypothetical protein
MALDLSLSPASLRSLVLQSICLVSPGTVISDCAAFLLSIPPATVVCTLSIGLGCVISSVSLFGLLILEFSSRQIRSRCFAPSLSRVRVVQTYPVSIVTDPGPEHKCECLRMVCSLSNTQILQFPAFFCVPAGCFFLAVFLIHLSGFCAHQSAFTHASCDLTRVHASCRVLSNSVKYAPSILPLLYPRCRPS